MATETTVNVKDLRKNLSGYLRQARHGNQIVVTSGGEVVARIVPPGPETNPKRQLIGLLEGRIRMAPDFDETPADLVAAMEGGEAAREERRGGGGYVLAGFRFCSSQSSR